jgi:hypothetical protein
MARKDIHRPSAIDPADYEFIAFDYLPNEGDILGNAMFLASERRRKVAHMERSGGRYSSHEHGGLCHICGSVNAIYSASFYHPKSNSYIKAGLDCAEKLECEGIEAFRKSVRKGLEANKGKGKAKAVLEAAGMDEAWAMYVAKADGRDESVVADMVGKLVKYGSLSDKAMDFMGVLLDRIKRAPEIAAARAAESEAAKPVPAFEGRVWIEGEVLSVKKEDGFYGYSEKALVRHADGWKLFGNLPGALHGKVSRGDKLKFKASVKVSDNDPKFGFWSRPASAEVFKKEEVAA